MDHADPSPTVSAERCPLCRQPNRCAMAAANNDAACATACWCVTARFSPDLLARVPAAARRVACICARCAGASTDA